MSIIVEEMQKCHRCIHLQKSVHMVLDDDILYSCWCKNSRCMGECKCKYFEEDEKNEHKMQ